MIPSAFEYFVPGSLAEALNLLATFGDDAKVLAGGHSLLPAMKLRLAAPKVIVDIGRLQELAYIRQEDGAVAIGALTTHHRLEVAEELRAAATALWEAAGVVGDPQVRNRGTIGGVLAHADPAADYPAALLALDAQIRVAGPRGPRTVAAADWFLGPYTTALGPGEIVTEVRIPLALGRTGSAYVKLARRASDYALVGAAARVTLDGDGVVRDARVALTGVAPAPYRAQGVEQALLGSRPDPEVLAGAAKAATRGVEVNDDVLVSAEYRAHVARVYVRRALERAVARATACP